MTDAGAIRRESAQSIRGGPAKAHARAAAAAPTTTPALGDIVPLIGAPRARLLRSRLDGVRTRLKRAFDIVVASLALILLGPFMALIALGVVATSRGPVFHTSVRIGRYGRPFDMPKFRTMRVGCPSCPREMLGDAEDRITPLGKLLRRTGLDELPQLISVLRGDMSLIGPRPLLAEDPAASEREKFPQAMVVRPGISGLAQVSGRNLVTPRRKARLDAFYARKPSLRFDLMLILRTALVVLTGKGFM